MVGDSQETVMLDGADDICDEEVAKLVSLDSIKRVVSLSESFCLSQPTSEPSSQPLSEYHRMFHCHYCVHHNH